MKKYEPGHLLSLDALIRQIVAGRSVYLSIGGRGRVRVWSAKWAINLPLSMLARVVSHGGARFARKRR